MTGWTLPAARLGPASEMLYYGFGPAALVELLADVVHGWPHRFQADTKLVGGFLRDETLHQLIEDFHFPRRELLGIDLRFLTAVEEPHE